MEKYCLKYAHLISEWYIYDIYWLTYKLQDTHWSIFRCIFEHKISKADLFAKCKIWWYRDIVRTCESLLCIIVVDKNISIERRLPWFSWITPEGCWRMDWLKHCINLYNYVKMWFNRPKCIGYFRKTPLRFHTETHWFTSKSH